MGDGAVHAACASPIEGSGFWECPAPFSPTLVTENETLETIRPVVLNSEVVALDAEWEPGSKFPRATLVQLAAWSHDVGLYVILLDTLSLPIASVRSMIQEMLDNPRSIVVGYGLRTDLQSIGIHRSPQSLAHAVDLNRLQNTLANRMPYHLRPAGAGLGALIEAHLGQSLDKSQQCSRWGDRPLSDAQLHYAALDSVCLLGVLQSLIVHTESSKVRDSPGTDSPALEPANADESCWPHFRREALWQVALTWPAYCWDSAKQIRKRDARRRHTTEVVTLAPIAFLPREVPPKFVCDVMLHGLARQLRLIGVDAEVMDTVAAGQRHVTFRRMVGMAEDQGRWVLTRDIGFINSRYTDLVYWVRADDRKLQAEEVIQAFKLDLARQSLLSRCAKCNGSFLPDPVGPADVESLQVPEGVLLRQKEFWVCAKCRSVYWKGSQYEAAISRLTQMTTRLSLNSC
ncbi:hypothetical protein ACKKBG_A33275 [Auxenochlorella protothecoides x Auxenochlorella symbiontica]